MSSRLAIVLGVLFAASGVLLGAYSAHGLDEQLRSAGFETEDVAMRIGTRWEPAVRYQMYHAIGLILVGVVSPHRRNRGTDIAVWMFVAGILIFCGLLYVLTFTGDSWRWLGMIVPFGGIAFVIGWIGLAVGAWRGGLSPNEGAQIRPE